MKDKLPLGEQIIGNDELGLVFVHPKRFINNGYCTGLNSNVGFRDFSSILILNPHGYLSFCGGFSLY